MLVCVHVCLQELSEYLGMVKLNERLQEPSLQEYFSGIFPQDSMQNMRFSINFFTSIGLGGITDRQRELYKQVRMRDQCMDNARDLNRGGPGSPPDTFTPCSSCESSVVLSRVLFCSVEQACKPARHQAEHVCTVRTEGCPCTFMFGCPANYPYPCRALPPPE